MNIYLGWIFIVGFWLTYLYVTLLNPIGTGAWDVISVPEKVLLTWGGVGGIGIWLWMLGAHFKGNQSRFPVLWGFFLIIANIADATLYFFFVYRKKHLTSQSSTPACHAGRTR